MAFLKIQYAKKRSKCSMFNLTFIGTIHVSFQYNRYNVLARVEHDTTLIRLFANSAIDNHI